MSRIARSAILERGLLPSLFGIKDLADLAKALRLGELEGTTLFGPADGKRGGTLPPSVHRRRERLIRGLDADDIDPRGWPWPTDTTVGLRQHADHRAEADRLGWHWWIADLEERWAVQQGKKPKGWADVDSWTRADFIRHIEQDKADGGSGGKERIAKRVHMSPSSLWRLWEKVLQDGESWPSGNKGPANR